MYPLRPGEAVRDRWFLILVAASAVPFWRRGPGTEPADEAMGWLRYHAVGHLLLAGANDRSQ